MYKIEGIVKIEKDLEEAKKTAKKIMKESDLLSCSVFIKQTEVYRLKRLSDGTIWPIVELFNQ
jgi:hypothetical protein